MNGQPQHRNIFVVKNDGTGREFILDSLTNSNDSQWEERGQIRTVSSDGTTAWGSGERDDGKAVVFMLRADGSKTEIEVNGPADNFDWRFETSKNGNIAWGVKSDWNGNDFLYIVDAYGGYKELPTNYAHNENIQFSADGNSIYLNGYGTDGKIQAMVYSVPAGLQLALTTSQFVALNTAQISALSTDALSVLTDTQLRVLTTTQERALSTTQIAALSTRSMVALTTTHINSITSAQLSAITSAQIAMLSTAAIRQLNTSQLGVLRSEQLEGITGAQLNTLTTSQLAGVLTSSIAGLTSAAISGLSTSQLAVLNTSQLSSLDDSAFAGFSTLQVSRLSTAQMAAITADQLASLKDSSFWALNTSQMSSLSTQTIAQLSIEQIQKIEVEDISAMSAAQVSSMSSAQIAVFAPNQISVMSSTQIAAISTSAVAGFRTDLMYAIHTSTLASLTTVGMTDSQYQIFQSLTGITPLVLDLDGNGIDTLSVNQGVLFDHAGAGSRTQTGWVGGKDGLLVRDLNSDGVINDGRELFGQGTLLASGNTAQHGYQALAAMDTNLDGVISAADNGFSSLMVWSETVSAGNAAGSGKLQSLAELGIASISLSYQQSDVLNNGNLVGLMGSYTAADGQIHAMGDVWFQIDKSGNRVFDLAAVVAANQANVSPGRVQLGEGSQTLIVSLPDVIHEGKVDVLGDYQLIIDGDETDAVALSGGGQWFASSQVDIGAECYAVYADPNHQAKLLVNDKMLVWW